MHHRNMVAFIAHEVVHSDYINEIKYNLQWRFATQLSDNFKKHCCVSQKVTFNFAFPSSSIDSLQKS
jgi:hypothetical protein